jgi:DNA-binding response OmpR family regulator
MALEDRGYETVVARCAAESHEALDVAQPDLIILDLLLPDADGLVLCGDLKARTEAPILVCSALPPQPNAVLSLRLGADDYLAKPFNVDELEARVAALLRRGLPAGTREDGLVVRPAQRLATLGQIPLPLTPTEYELLAALAERPGEAFSREELGRRVWRSYDTAIGRSIDVHVAHLRAKWAAAARGGPAGGERDLVAPTIEAVRGFGFRLKDPTHAASGTRGAVLGRR